MESVKRRYNAPARQQQAERTRQRIAEAALEVFTTCGWSGATVAEIAGRAGVTSQAVYLAVGGKPALLVRAVETAVAGASDDVPLAERPSFAAAFAPDLDPDERIRAYVAAAAAAYTRSARLFLVLQDAARSDPTAAEQAAAGAQRRLVGVRNLAAALRPDLELGALEQLADTIWALAAPGPYVDLVHHRGWTEDAYRALLVTLLEAAAGR